jgi:uncharacterized protein YcnI
MAIPAIYRRTGAVTAGALALTLGLALPALAHVTIDPGTADKGGFAKIAFRVPNERDNASTTKLEVTFPTDNPLPFVSVKPVPGWDAKLQQGKLPKPIVSDDGDKVTESVLKITWSGGKINSGEFQEFEVSVGPLPKTVDQLIFPTVQTYSSGEKVNWTDLPKPDGSEPAHPAPVLKLVAATGDDAGASSAPAAGQSSAPSLAVVTPSSGDSAASDTTARILGGLGIVVGVVGAGAGMAGLRRSRA